MKHSNTEKITGSALCLALALVLPFLTGQIPQIGAMLCPMHLPVLLCGFWFGCPLGSLVGFTAPLLRSLIFGMPPLFPAAIAMAFELCAYGFLSGFLYRRLPKKTVCLYLSLVLSMVGGRLLWGFVQFLLLGINGTTFPFSVFFAGAVTETIPGILLQLVLLPLLVLFLQKKGHIYDT